ncbi:MAG: hypothetical protein KA792_02295 [Bacteroidales bacterium]|nr:hypothetical protein [Bacteroidales bacterium]
MNNIYIFNSINKFKNNFLTNKLLIFTLFFLLILNLNLKAQDILVAEYKFETDQQGWIWQAYTSTGGATSSPTAGYISTVNWALNGGTAGCIRHNTPSATVGGYWFARSPGLSLTAGKEYYVKFGVTLAGANTTTINQRVQVRIGTSTAANGGTIVMGSTYLPLTAGGAANYVEFTSPIYTASVTQTHYIAVGDFFNKGAWACYYDGIRIYEVYSATAAISTETISGSTFCLEGSLSVPFTVTGVFNPGNTFTAQLSDAAGSFTSPTDIGSLAGTTDGTISATIPLGTPVGSGYRIRVIADNPATIGTDNGSNLTVTAGSVYKYRSAGSGNWSNPSIWEYNTCGSAYFPAITAPDYSNNDGIIIQNGHIVTVDVDVTADQLTIDNTANSTLIINNGVILTINDGVGNDLELNTNSRLTVNGTLINQGQINGSTATTTTFNNNSVYNHSVNGGTVPTAIWNTGSECRITGVTNTAPTTGVSQSFYNFTWHCAGQTTTLGLTGSYNPSNVSGTFSITETNNSIFDLTGINRSWTGNMIISGNSRVFFLRSTGTSSNLTVNNFDIISVTGMSPAIDINNSITTGSSANLTINGNLTINSPLNGLTWGNLSGNFSTVNIGGNFIHINGSLLAGNSATNRLQFVNSGTKSISSYDNLNITLNALNLNGGTLDIGNSTLAPVSHISISTGTTLILGSSGLINNNGNFTLNTGANIYIASLEGISSSGATGNVQSSGSRTFSIGANYTYNGQANQITGDGFTGGNNLTIDNINNLTLTENATISGNLNFTNGNLTINNTKALTLTGTAILNANNTIISGAGKLKLTGTANIINNILTLENLEIEGIGEIASGAGNYVYLKGILTPTSGNFTTNANLKLISTSGKTAIIEAGAANISGDVTIQRYIGGTDGYHYISSPFTNTTAGNLAAFGTGAPVWDQDFSTYSSGPISNIWAYVENNTSQNLKPSGTWQNGWVSPASSGSILNPMTGYALMTSAGNTIELTGTVNSGSISMNPTYTASANPGDDGWNLVGNPYPSPIDWNAVGWTKTNINNAIYMYKASSVNSGSYSSYVGGVSSDGIISNIIPAMQAFWIRTTANGVLGLNNTERTNHTTPTFFKKSTNEKQLIRLAAFATKHSDKKDYTVLYTDNAATSAFDSDYDAYKILNQDEDMPNLASLSSDGNKLSINGLNEFASLIPLYFSAEKADKYNITIINTDNLPCDIEIYLEDIQLNTLHNLSKNGVYSFDYNPADKAQRFYLHIKSAISTEINRLTSTEPYIIYTNNSINIYSNTKSIITVNIYNLLGDKIYCKDYKTNKISISDKSLSDAYYIVQVITENKNFVKKIYLNK